MAFSTTLIKWGIIGDRRYEIRSFTNTAGSTGGEVTFAHLKRILNAWLQEKSAGTIAAGAVVNETFPLAKNAVTIVTQGTSTGYIMALGDPC